MRFRRTGTPHRDDVPQHCEKCGLAVLPAEPPEVPESTRRFPDGVARGGPLPIASEVRCQSVLHVAGVTAIWAAMVLPSALLHELRGEEGRFALAARDMLEHGRWLLPEVLGEPYLNKPPLLLWLIAGAMWLIGGEAVWTIRLPTIAGMLAAAWLVASAVRRSAGTVPSILAVLALFSMPMIMELPAQAETDRLLVPLVFSAALLWFAGLGQPDRSHLRVACWGGCAAMLALAAMTKGPIPVTMVLIAAGVHAVIARQPAQLSTVIAMSALAMVPLGLWA